MPELNIIGLVGYKGSGKDEVANILVRDYGYVKRSFAEPLKKSLQIIFGLTDEELNDPTLKEKPLNRWPYLSPRQLMQEVGTDLFRKRFPGVWLNAWEVSTAGQRRVVCPDVRFKDEANLIHNKGGIIVRVFRPSRAQTDHHDSEVEQASIRNNLLVTNDGDLNHLETALRHVLWPSVCRVN